MADKPKLQYDQLFAVNGGNSLKQYADKGNSLALTFESDYFLTHEEVDVYKNEAVKKTEKQVKKQRQQAIVEDSKSSSDKHAEDFAHKLGQAQFEDHNDGQWVVKNLSPK